MKEVQRGEEETHQRTICKTRSFGLGLCSVTIYIDYMAWTSIVRNDEKDYLMYQYRTFW